MPSKPEMDKPRQKRAEITRNKICEAAITLLGTGGAKAVTHRAVAELAGVSLASTTYHFSDKADLLTAAFEWLIDHYIEQSRNKLEDALGAEATRQELTNHIISVSRQGMTIPDQRVLVGAWYEFMLEACRDEKLQKTAEKWYEDTCCHYQDILEWFGSHAPKDDTRRLVDFLIGYEFLSLAIGPLKSGSREMTAIYSRFVESMFDDKKETSRRKPRSRPKQKARAGNS